MSGVGTTRRQLLNAFAMRGRLYESEYEEALIDLLQSEGWQYTNGKTIHRPVREALLVDELKASLLDRYADLTPQQ